jgi:FKBP-type peptidyl-prolyl cis-trans isomerase FkpA
MLHSSFIFCLVGIVLFSSCSSHKGKKERSAEADPVAMKQQLVNANVSVIHHESEQIQFYIKKHKWQMQETGTGLRYMIYKNGLGTMAKPGNLIKLKYGVSLLDSTICYPFETTEPIEFSVNQSDQIRGLHELALHLKKGDKVKAILPPHLAYGLSGDGNKIPSREVLVYDIEVLNIKQ